MTRSNKAALDPFAAGLFPLCPSTHDSGIRWLFDLSTLLLLLDCRPGDRVLDIGAGSGSSSEMLARLGYDVIAVDPNHTALQHNRRRPSFDSSRIQGTVRVTQGTAQYLPLGDAVFDGALGMNVLHHVPDLDAALVELHRVLKPGSRAVFCEPGLDHLDHPETKRAMREHGENDRPFDVLAFLETARRRGFAEMMLSATLQAPLTLLPLDEIDVFLSGQHPRAHLTAAGVLDELHRRHAYAMIVREGARTKTSRHPGVLRCQLDVDGVPPRVARGETIRPVIKVRNTGDSIWLAEPVSFGGYVTVGCKILNAEGRLVTDSLGRTFLPADIYPDQEATVTMAIELPQSCAPGRYTLQFDLVDELVRWFSDVSPSASAQAETSRQVIVQ